MCLYTVHTLTFNEIFFHPWFTLHFFSTACSSTPFRPFAVSGASVIVTPDVNKIHSLFLNITTYIKYSFNGKSSYENVTKLMAFPVFKTKSHTYVQYSNYNCLQYIYQWNDFSRVPKSNKRPYAYKIRRTMFFLHNYKIRVKLTYHNG